MTEQEVYKELARKVNENIEQEYAKLSNVEKKKHAMNSLRIALFTKYRAEQLHKP